MKTSLFNIIRGQKKIVNTFIFLISWSQIHAQTNSLFLHSEESRPADETHTGLSPEPPQPIFSTKKINKSEDQSASKIINEAGKQPTYEEILRNSRPSGNARFTIPGNISSSRLFRSDIKQGIIGKDEENPIDQVYDNIFTVSVNEIVKPTSSAWLEYELYGVTEASGVSKYINDELATGGNNVEKNSQWSFHSEALPTSALVQGKNKITFTIPNNADYTYKVRNVHIRIDKSIPSSYKAKVAASALVKNIAVGEAGELNWEGAELKVDKGILKKSQNFSVTALRDIDVPATTPELVNVTQQHFAYRFLPHGEHFSIPAKVTMAYDKSKIPAGYTEQDIRAFYFDDVQKKWIVLERDSLMTGKQALVSKTTHFTDMITGVIKVPESPETGNYAPNSIKDIKAADPSSGIVSIGAPSPNSMGTVNTSFPIKLPAGRQGMQPSLSVNYNSEGGNGWMGLGWDLSIPAISIDTRWGVPLYLDKEETEIYSFGGEQLTFKYEDKFVLPNRTEGSGKPRVANRQFYPRIEGAYNKIIRHGENPREYWWEVISKDGTRSFFGGDGASVVENAVLRQPGSNNIGHWALYKTIDTNGNYVKYNYDTPTYNASGTIGNGGKEMYIGTIEYTLNDANTSLKKYSVNFGYDAAQRDDVQVDARLGFVRVTSKRLGNIQVLYDGAKVRSYEFKYKTGAFTKSLLETVTEKKADDQVFYTNRIEYFNNIETSQYAQETTINGIANDAEIKSSSLLGHGDSKSSTFGGALTFGVANPGDTQAYNPITKSVTIGGDYQYTEGEGGGRLTLADVDGDGLPDKVLKNDWKSPGAVFKYRKKGLDTAAFGDTLRVAENSKSFSYSKSFTNSFGIQFNASMLLTAGVSTGTSKTKDFTYNYFTDANSDGIQDIVSNGQVYFGRVEGGVVKYSTDVLLTPNPITKGAAVSTPAVDCNDLLEDYKNSPLHDVVKVWRAPYDGTVSVTGVIKLKNPSSSPDGVKFTLQQYQPETNTSNMLVPATVLNGAAGYYVNQPSVSVKQGDYLYFRVNSRDNGIGDILELPVTITYIIGPMAYPYPGSLWDWYRDSSETPLGLFTNMSLVSGKNGTGVPVNSTTGTIAGTLIKPVTVKDIHINVIRKQADGTVSTVGSQQLAAATTGSQSLLFNTGALAENDILYFQVQSEVNEKWENLNFNNLKLTINYEGNNIELPVVPDIQFYNLRNNTTATFKPWIDMRGRDGNYSLYAKLTGKPAGRYTYIVRKRLMQRGNFVEPIITTINWTGSVNTVQELAISLPIIRWNDYYVECYTDVAAYSGLDSPIPNLEVEIRESVNVNPAAPTVFETHGINVYGKDTDKIYQEGSGTSLSKDEARFGAMYRSWGQFIYHGGYGTLPASCSSLQNQLPDYGSQPIDPSKLIPPSDPNDPTPLKERMFMTMSPYYGRDLNDTDNINYVQRYTGISKTTYTQGTDISSSRMGMNDMSVLSQSTPAGGAGVFNAPVKQAKTRNTNSGRSLGASIFSLNDTDSSGETINILDYFDMNGDGYPDVLNGNVIQYTNMIGKLSEVTLPGANENSHRTDHLNTGSGMGQNYPLSGKSNESTDQTALKAVEPGINFSAGSSEGRDWSSYSYIDINGDGLLDRVTPGGQIQLNLGYSYANTETLPYGDFRNGTTTSSNLGAGASIGGTITDNLPKGISMFNASISFGAGKSETLNDQKTTLIDINNDGLADLVTNNGGNLSVQINTGNRFVAIPWNAASNIQQDVSRGFNTNIGLTVSILIPIGTTGSSFKISVNPSTSFGEGDSNVRQQILDLNGDGFPDLLTSHADGSGNFSNTAASVKYSTIGTTNLLKKVTTPMGGSWEVAYERTGNTYDLPQSKWIMTSVVSHDGFTGDNQFKPDVSKITVAYENPYHSRRERTFYGFDKVRTNQINTGNGGASSTEVYRYTLQNFNNSSYFLKGALLSETLYDAANKKWTEKNNTFSLRAINDTIPVANILTREAEKNLITYGYFTSLDKTTSSFYEGMAAAGKSTTTKMVYDKYGNLKKNMDYGDMQIGASELLTSEIEYQITDNLTAYLILPTNIKSTAAGVVRERKAQYDLNGNVTDITMVGPGNPVNSYEYDIYGNIKKATGPVNHQGQRFFHEYTYDPDVATYPTVVKDAFGYSSKSEYDFRFGVPVFSEDMNLQPTQYAYDAAGRTTEITGPYEMFNDIPWTIQFEYKPITDAPLNATGAQSYAVTRHYDPDNANNTINTVSISDGFGSPVQVKKTADLYQKGLKYVVSGKIVQDAFGRALKTYYPTEAAASGYTYDATVDNIVPTINTYDVLDRVLTTKLPDEDLISEVEYGFGNDREGRPMFRTIMTDELGTIKKTYTDIKGRTTTVHEPSNTRDIFTSFTHDAIGELLKVRDVQNNLTTSVYDDLGRRISMTHPDSGTSTFVYDPANNMTSRTNAENETVTYTYDYSRLNAVIYPKYPENNVKYYYGQAMDASAMDNNSVGRLWYQTDATGTQYMKYGRLGELTLQRRSVAVPGAGVYWFATEWEYDTWNRVKTITYPDGEKVTYKYNLAGNLNTMTSVKDGFARNIIDELGYDKFDQRVFLKYGNKTTTSYEYETKRRRLLRMNAQTPGNRYFMKNLYQYDVVSNVLQIHNNAPVAQAGLLGGGTNHAYGYDDLYRLTSSNGNWRGINAQGQEERQRYTVTMAYDNMHNVMSKTQKHERAMGNTGNVWNNIDATSYRLNYRYESAKPHAPTTVIDEPNVPGALCCDPNNPQVKFQNYTYDKKGNPTGIQQQTCQEIEPKTAYRWDEENRLRFVDTNPSTPEIDGASIYTYDAGGERIIKNILYSGIIVRESQPGSQEMSYKASIYPNALVSATLTYDNEGNALIPLSYTKHYYAGSQRINSKLGQGKDVGKFNCGWLIIPFGNGSATINEKTVAKEKLDANTAASLAIMAAYGITPPPNYGQNAGYNEICVSSYAGVEEKDTYWYHPDHLGSSSFITGLDGEVTQNIEYFPSGEVFVENHKNSYNTPYKFNGKEQDDETGYYYYGARYYNPRVSLWLNVDPLADYNPFYNDQAYIDGEHNGGVYNSGNNNPYIYTYHNPLIFIDPNGKQTINEFTSGVKVDMNKAPYAKNTNAKGFARNGEWFWKQVYNKNPEMFSNTNIWKINNGLAPVVDKTWVEFNPSHAGYMRDILIHHHIDQGRFAVGIPQEVHRSFFKQLHNRSANWFKMNRVTSIGKTLNALGTFAALIDMYKISIKNPDAAFSSFDQTAPLNTLRGLSDYSSGSFQNYYYEIKSRNTTNTSLMIEFYNDYEKVNGIYRGVGQGAPAKVDIKNNKATITPVTIN